MSRRSATAVEQRALQVLAGSNHYRLARARRRQGRTHLVFNLLRHGQKSLLYIPGVLCRCLEEGDRSLVSKCLRHTVLNDLVAGEVRLVANKDFVHTFRSIVVDLLQPLLHVGERIVVGDIVDDNDAVRSTVIRRGDSVETFVSCGIPNVEFDYLSLEPNSANLEIDTERREDLCVGIVHKTAKDAGLSNALVTDEEQFEKVVALASVHGEGKRSGGRSQWKARQG